MDRLVNAFTSNVISPCLFPCYHPYFRHRDILNRPLHLDRVTRFLVLRLYLCCHLVTTSTFFANDISKWKLRRSGSAWHFLFEMFLYQIFGSVIEAFFANLSMLCIILWFFVGKKRAAAICNLHSLYISKNAIISNKKDLKDEICTNWRLSAARKKSWVDSPWDLAVIRLWSSLDDCDSCIRPAVWHRERFEFDPASSRFRERAFLRLKRIRFVLSEEIFQLQHPLLTQTVCLGVTRRSTETQRTDLSRIGVKYHRHR